MKEKDKEVEKAVEVGHEQVEASLLAKFDAMKAEEAEVQGNVDPTPSGFRLSFGPQRGSLDLPKIPNAQKNP